MDPQGDTHEPVFRARELSVFLVLANLQEREQGKSFLETNCYLSD